jgi:hypothetical protein
MFLRLKEKVDSVGEKEEFSIMPLGVGRLQGDFSREGNVVDFPPLSIARSLEFVEGVRPQASNYVAEGLSGNSSSVGLVGKRNFSLISSTGDY